MNSRYQVLLIITFITISPVISAQFSIDAQYRNRMELRDGYKHLSESGSNPAFFISQRTRISLNYANDFLELKFTPQDVRLWGDEDLVSSTGVFGKNASLDLFEAWLDLKTGNKARFRIGRQQWVYDNQRMLAARNWNQLGISYDGLLFKLRLVQWNIHLAASWNTMLETLTENTYPSNRIKSLNFLWINHKHGNASISFTHIASGVTKTDTTNMLFFRQTSGLYAEYAAKHVKLWADAYYQYGKNRTGMPVSAFLLDVDISCKTGVIEPGLGASYLSGNSGTVSGNSTDHLFDILYGARHKYFGTMDYFRNFPSDTKGGGLTDLYAYLNFKLSKSVILQERGHYFRLAQTISSISQDKDLAFENDLVIKYTIREWCNLEGGYCFLLPSETLKKIQSVPDEKLPQFVYLQLTVTPTLFKQKPANKL